MNHAEAEALKRGIKHGYRSGLEDKISADLEAKGLPVKYEVDKLRYTVPASEHTYTPDWRIDRPDGTFFYVEGKGRFDTADRKKHLLVRAANPSIEIRFLFSNPNQRISKTSSTTYAKWCETNGFVYAKGPEFPNEWLT